MNRTRYGPCAGLGIALVVILAFSVPVIAKNTQSNAATNVAADVQGMAVDTQKNVVTQPLGLANNVQVNALNLNPVAASNTPGIAALLNGASPGNHDRNTAANEAATTRDAKPNTGPATIIAGVVHANRTAIHPGAEISPHLNAATTLAG